MGLGHEKLFSGYLVILSENLVQRFSGQVNRRVDDRIGLFVGQLAKFTQMIDDRGLESSERHSLGGRRRGGAAARCSFSTHSSIMVSDFIVVAN